MQYIVHDSSHIPLGLFPGRKMLISCEVVQVEILSGMKSRLIFEIA